ncbi:MAG: hypothetical protein HYV17_00895 [Xanthomonadales bacterium]|nr:hypothetical protein [Xanthomonadales bacterium]
MPDHSHFSNLIWQIADLLRGRYRPQQYERVMLPVPDVCAQFKAPSKDTFTMLGSLAVKLDLRAKGAT